MGMFKKGYNAVREEEQRQKENREKMGKQLWRFFLTGDGSEATVRFLTEEPINFYEHSVKVIRGGKERYDNVVCTHDLGECSLCDNGDRPQFKGAYLIYDKRPYEYKDKNGKKQTGKGQLKLYVQGSRVLSQLDRLSERYGLTDRDYTITRTGSGTSVTYMFDRSDDVGKLSEAEITNMLPEKLRDMYDGTMESLYAIVQNQLEMLIQDNGGSDTKDDNPPFDSDEEVSSKNLVSLDDEDTPPNRTGTLKKPMFKSKLPKPKENSVKKFFKR